MKEIWFAATFFHYYFTKFQSFSPCFGARIRSLDVATSTSVVTSADVASAIHWAVAQGADVVNLSLRFEGESQTLKHACSAAAKSGAIVVAAAGNENQGETFVYPASYDSVVSVAAVDVGYDIADFSQQNDQEELAAPDELAFLHRDGDDAPGDV